MNTTTKKICYCAMLAALLAAASQLAVPIPFSPAPLSLSILMVLLCGIFGPAIAGLSVIVYIFLGAIGLPVFAGFRGFESLVSPTGGFIIGYFPAALASGFAFKHLKNQVSIFLSLAGAVALCYLCAVVFYSLYTSVSILDSILVCAVPFVPLDILKALIATTAGIRIKKLVRQ